jgi:hypothetical protein
LNKILPENRYHLIHGYFLSYRTQAKILWLFLRFLPRLKNKEILKSFGPYEKKLENILGKIQTLIFQKIFFCYPVFSLNSLTINLMNEFWI